MHRNGQYGRRDKGRHSADQSKIREAHNLEGDARRRHGSSHL